MKVLVTAASRHGSTLEVAEAIAQRLKTHGIDVEQLPPESVDSLDPYDGVVVGSAVYLRQWADTAKNFVQRFHQDLRDKPSWAFSVGISEVAKGRPEDVHRIGPVAVDGVFHGQKVFPGRYDPSNLNLRERSIGYVAGAVEGDYRDWQEIGQWADEIAQELGA
ncbi:flavodoxin domain-containing protein [Scrofimicrobium sp. R131]|uniref:Flavodoxin domain-containing protein n=1 Tax=Scrofimicrobium appendicitidis TaxID=3079930 RepID=A0AAU7V9Y7_9ACTO